jgi:hypothetical protein
LVFYIDVFDFDVVIAIGYLRVNGNFLVSEISASHEPLEETVGIICFCRKDRNVFIEMQLGVVDAARNCSGVEDYLLLGPNIGDIFEIFGLIFVVILAVLVYLAIIAVVAFYFERWIFGSQMGFYFLEHGNGINMADDFFVAGNDSILEST